jgi:hypothetical protein
MNSNGQSQGARLAEIAQRLFHGRELRATRGEAQRQKLIAGGEVLFLDTAKIFEIGRQVAHRIPFACCVAIALQSTDASIAQSGDCGVGVFWRVSVVGPIAQRGYSAIESLERSQQIA